MADTFKFQKDWYEAIVNDKYVSTTPQEMAYILYAAMQYAFNDGNPIDLGEVFGKEFGGLNRSMPNIYGQMDRIRNYERGKSSDTYDHEAIYRLRMEGKKGKEICQILGYPLEKERSLSSTKGWKRAAKDKAEGIILKDIEDTEICTESVKNTDITEILDEIDVKSDTDGIVKLQKSVKNTEICTDTVHTDNTESVQNVHFEF